MSEEGLMRRLWYGFQRWWVNLLLIFSTDALPCEKCGSYFFRGYRYCYYCGERNSHFIKRRIIGMTESECRRGHPSQKWRVRLWPQYYCIRCGRRLK